MKSITIYGIALLAGLFLISTMLPAAEKQGKENKR